MTFFKSYLNTSSLFQSKNISDEEKLIDYIEKTYSEHYSVDKSGFQVQDMLRHLDIDKDFCQANAIKYLCRFGKKNGKNKVDLYKAVHYIVLLLDSLDNEDTKNN